MRNINDVLIVLGYLSVIALGMTVSKMAYNDEIAEEKYYCEMVNNGHWPNYKGVDCDE